MGINNETVKMIDSFKNLSESIKKMFDSNIFANIELSVSELKLLETIDANSKENKLVNTSDLANSLKVSKSAVSQSIAKLEKKGYIKRKISLKDKKIGYLYLTDECKIKCEEKRKVCENIIENVVDLLGEEKILKLSDLLNELSEVIENIRREKVC